jgi:hypothetical protein
MFFEKAGLSVILKPTVFYSLKILANLKSVSPDGRRRGKFYSLPYFYFP